MKAYHQNGIVSEDKSIISEDEVFAIQCDTENGAPSFFYPGDNLIREIDLALIDIADLFVDIYFPDWELYNSEVSNIPLGIALGGQNSDICINKTQFLNLVPVYASYFKDLYRHIYVADCQYLTSTVQRLLQATEHCFVQYYTQITNIDSLDYSLGEEQMTCSPETRQLAFYLETFFTKAYSILDLIVKIAFELENPIESFSSITKLKSSEKIWGNRKQLRMNGTQDTIFEDCIVIKQIEALRNEAVHNGTWEFAPKVFLRIEDSTIIERYMLFPDFEEGHLAAVKNRRHFFSSGTKVNDALIPIHEEFYRRLLTTLQNIVKYNANVE